MRSIRNQLVLSLSDTVPYGTYFPLPPGTRVRGLRLYGGWQNDALSVESLRIRVHAHPSAPLTFAAAILGVQLLDCTFATTAATLEPVNPTVRHHFDLEIPFLFEVGGGDEFLSVAFDASDSANTQFIVALRLD